MAKVLLINGSGNEHGCTFTALSEVAKALNEEGVETEIIQLGKDAIRDCIGCGSCGKLGRCVFDDDQVNLVAAKAKEAEELVEHLCSGIATETASKDFDAYCQYTYMDNVLRGGYPIRLGSHKIFYVYSRKHGDLERDYNYFSMLPEFYSQGNGNFRDVNQNRRCGSGCKMF